MERSVRGGNRSRYSKRDVEDDSNASCGSMGVLLLLGGIGVAEDADTDAATPVPAALLDGGGEGPPPTSALLRLPAIDASF